MSKSQRSHPVFPTERNRSNGLSRIELLAFLIYVRSVSANNTHANIRLCAKEALGLAHDFFDVMEETGLGEDQD